jgi:hypothetical protein
MFMGEITRHNNTHKAKGADDGVAMTAFQAKALFMLLDDDESGELEPDEIFGVLEERQLLGQDKEAKMKSEVKDQLMASYGAFKRWI